VKRRDEIRNIPSEAGQPSLTGIVLPPRIKEVNLPSPTDLDKLAQSSPSEEMRDLSADARVQVTKLYDNIKSELHSRGSFSLSCLTLVLFGAALGILLKGKNPLAVFVLGFVPAIVLVLLITAGRQLAEGSHNHVPAGIILIWAGNVVLLGLVAAVYAKLLRQ
jgi:lipopolysaccharide export LptBFGC system permease protein LptF